MTPARRPNGSNRVRALSAPLLLALSACHGLGTPERSGPAHARQLAAPAPVAPAPAAAQDPVAAIARFEDARRDGDGLLMVLAAQGEANTRERAAVALGRLGWPEHGARVTEALVLALVDGAPRVRAAAAFALGQRADPAAARALLERLADENGAPREKDELVRARVVEALGRIAPAVVDRTAIVAGVLARLDDVAVSVRCEAALAPQRWPTDASEAGTVDAALVDWLRRARPAPASVRTAESSPADVETAWRAVFTLARRKCASARAVFVDALASSDARLRLHGAIGLGALPYDATSQAALHRVLADADDRVVCEAVRAIGSHTDADTPAQLEKLLAHRSAHVQRLAFEAWGNVAKELAGDRTLSSRALTLESPNVRNAAFVSDAKLRGDAVEPAIVLRLADKDPLARVAAAQAARHLSRSAALPLLLRLAQDDDVRVIEAACESLGTLDDALAHQKLVALLDASDNGVRLAAIEALEEHPRVGDLEALERCLVTSRGEIANEVAARVLDVALRIARLAPGLDTVDQTTRERASALLARGAQHADPYVRRRASELHAQLFHVVTPLRTSAPPTEATASVPLPGVDYEPGARPRVIVDTSRGALVFELFTDETPVHVYNFVELVKRHFYDGTTFHRVVPDFVIQGGDLRGDGNGGSSWRGDALRAEFTPRKFVRGSLGMPRNADPDSGGSQIFVCHRETPHLDGRYTLFGQLVDGFDVLDQIEVGDKIVTARLVNGAASR